MRRCTMNTDDPQTFQSAPGREAGRCNAPLGQTTIDGLFQSAPGREAGRCTDSISGAVSVSGFNPRPAVRPGDALSSRALRNLP